LHFVCPDIALKWLRQIRSSTRKEIYDSFFVRGPPTEVIQALVPALSQNEGSKEDHNIFCLNIERSILKQPSTYDMSSHLNLVSVKLFWSGQLSSFFY
jgi:hypothetical protein